jgi:hypothetical protein
MSDLKSYKVEIVRYQTVKPFLEKYHYSHNTNGIVVSYCFGLFKPQEALFGIPILVGAAIVGRPSMNRQAAKWWPTNPRQCYELRRLACIDDTPKNTESYFISKIILWLENNTDAEALLSYADPLYGHQGTIYKASNFQLVGKTAGDRVVQIQGQNFHSRTLTNTKPYAKRIRDDIASGNKKVKVIKTPPKFIYLYPLR